LAGVKRSYPVGNRLKYSAMKDKIWNIINLLLTANVFFVLAIFGWFVVGLCGKASNVNLGLDLWRSLWDPLFMPAISVLMAGAIGSGIYQKFNKWWADRQTLADD
jgi:TRAP-type C4-dicarboxylate transport system permease small subunit